MATADDDFRAALVNPQGYVLAGVRAQLDGDTDAIEEIFDLIERGGGSWSPWSPSPS
jgi:hypothetical protein